MEPRKLKKKPRKREKKPRKQKKMPGRGKGRMRSKTGRIGEAERATWGRIAKNRSKGNAKKARIQRSARIIEKAERRAAKKAERQEEKEASKSDKDDQKKALTKLGLQKMPSKSSLNKLTCVQKKIKE